MTQLILPALLALFYAALPAPWGLRALAATATLSVWLVAFSPVTPWQYQGPFSDLKAAFMLWFLALAALGVAIRVSSALAIGSSLHLKPPRNTVLSRTDRLLAACIGVTAGTAGTLALATALRGWAGGLSLHLGIAALMAAICLPALRLAGPARAFSVALLVTATSLTLAGGYLYPRLVLSQAERILPGAPRCLRTPDGMAPTMDQMRLLTLPRARPRHPNLVLTVMGPSGPESFRWSYRSFAFRSYDSYGGGPCP